MDHSDHAGGMGSTSTGSGVPSLFDVQKIYWAAIGSAVALATLVNFLNQILAVQRYRSQKAAPKSFFWLFFATSTAMARELNNVSLGTLRWGRWTLRFPSLGRTTLVLSNMILVIVLCFYKLDTLDPWSWEDIGYRTGFVAIAQLPLIFLLAGKKNIIGALTGVGYERLNWLHRWTARTLWLSVTVHMGFWFRNWARYDYIMVKLTNDPITQRGFAAWCILTFIVATSMAPVRRLSYELFVISHLITFAGFIAAVWLHSPDEVKVWVWLPIGLFALDRLLRATRLLYLNLNLSKFWTRKVDTVWANSAIFTCLPGGVTKISIEKPAFMWKPGQHVFLSCHSVIPLQSHPFTIATLPSDKKLEFFIKAQRGGTKGLFNHAVKSGTLPLTNQDSVRSTRPVGIEGPYGRMRSLGQFDSVIFFAGSTGATFTVPLLRNLVKSWRSIDEGWSHVLSGGDVALTRRIRFVWVVKSRDQLDWFKSQLQQAIEDTNSCLTSGFKTDRQVEMSIYVTCDEELVAEKGSKQSCCSPIVHGPVDEAISASTEKISSIEGKKDLHDNVEEISLNSSEQTSPEKQSCAPGGSCCCKATIEDESDGPSAGTICNCGRTAKVTTSGSSTNVPAPELHKPLAVSLNPPMRLLSGRPQPQIIIRKVLEDAEGESAVVVCGPQGLQDDVRASVVALSDERAVHKGTGAQGIYLHVEGFEY